MIRDLQFAIRMRFVNSANGHIRQVRIRRFVFVGRFASRVVFWRNQRTRISIDSYWFTSCFV